MVTIMSKKSRTEYLILRKKRYESSGKLEKKTILNEFVFAVDTTENMQYEF